MKYIIQFILLISAYTCFAWSDCDPKYIDSNYVDIFYTGDSASLKNIQCKTDSFYYTTTYYPNGQMAKERSTMYGDYFMNILNSWDTLGNPMVVNGNGYHYEYFKNGKIKKEGFYKNTIQDSTWKYYYINGNMASLTKYEVIDGVPINKEDNEYYTNGKIHRVTLFSERENGKSYPNIESYNVYDKENGKLIATGKGCKDSIMDNVDSLNKFFYMKAQGISEDVEGKDCYGLNLTTRVSGEINMQYEFNKAWYNDGTVRMKIEYDTTEKVLKYYEYHSNTVLKTTGNIRYYKFDDIDKNAVVKFKNKPGTTTVGLDCYLKCDIWKEYDGTGKLCSETNMNDETPYERLPGAWYMDTDE